MINCRWKYHSPANVNFEDLKLFCLILFLKFSFDFLQRMYKKNLKSSKVCFIEWFLSGRMIKRINCSWYSKKMEVFSTFKKPIMIHKENTEKVKCLKTCNKISFLWKAWNLGATFLFIYLFFAFEFRIIYIKVLKSI